MNEVRGDHTNAMKTSVYIPDDVYAEAARLASRTRKSLSRLFSDAVAEYLARHRPEEVAAAMDRVCSELGKTELGNKDKFVASAARRTLNGSEW